MKEKIKKAKRLAKKIERELKKKNYIIDIHSRMNFENNILKNGNVVLSVIQGKLSYKKEYDIKNFNIEIKPVYLYFKELGGIDIRLQGQHERKN